MDVWSITTAWSQSFNYIKLRCFLVYVPGSTWPAGTYGLMKPSQGCPDDTWQSGWREQDSEDFSNANQFSPNVDLYLAGMLSNEYTICYLLFSTLLLLTQPLKTQVLPKRTNVALFNFWKRTLFWNIIMEINVLCVLF